MVELVEQPALRLEPEQSVVGLGALADLVGELSHPPRGVVLELAPDSIRSAPRRRSARAAPPESPDRASGRARIPCSSSLPKAADDYSGRGRPDPSGGCTPRWPAARGSAGRTSPSWARARSPASRSESDCPDCSAVPSRRRWIPISACRRPRPNRPGRPVRAATGLAGRSGHAARRARGEASRTGRRPAGARHPGSGRRNGHGRDHARSVAPATPAPTAAPRPATPPGWRRRLNPPLFRRRAPRRPPSAPTPAPDPGPRPPSEFGFEH